MNAFTECWRGAGEDTGGGGDAESDGGGSKTLRVDVELERAAGESSEWEGITKWTREERIVVIPSSLQLRPKPRPDDNDDGEDNDDSNDDAEDPENTLTLTMTITTRPLSPPLPMKTSLPNPRSLIALAVKNGMLTTLFVCSFTPSPSSKRHEVGRHKGGG
ncbi:hypothetical protein GYMLUDRAFT_239153 [Collybiopsis luxurians FD-317 M1]|nr:hypothetical protein GYMLUDRAFT_239153 [Collybiopsis luxurians FD-317 M1]